MVPPSPHPPTLRYYGNSSDDDEILTVDSNSLNLPLHTFITMFADTHGQCIIPKRDNRKVTRLLQGKYLLHLMCLWCNSAPVDITPIPGCALLYLALYRCAASFLLFWLQRYWPMLLTNVIDQLLVKVAKGSSCIPIWGNLSCNFPVYQSRELLFL